MMKKFIFSLVAVLVLVLDGAAAFTGTANGDQYMGGMQMGQSGQSSSSQNSQANPSDMYMYTPALSQPSGSSSNQQPSQQSDGSSTSTSTSTSASTNDPSNSRNVLIQNFAFVPASITVPAGTTVTWTNRDSAAHTVTGDNAGGPSSGTLQPGQSYNFTFSQTGTFPYHCTIHPNMKGTVVVTSNASNGTSSGTDSEKQAQAPTAPSQTTTGTPSTTETTPPATEAQAQNPSTLPNTGAGNVVAAFLVAAAIGTGLATLYFRRKSS